mmetsp:Transcript_19619/g.45632  ORF Transcript_19619/g.45632 Transcript_19619/m.45632 type:complete len:243 (+) Transcript_19619:771-1499(+)
MRRRDQTVLLPMYEKCRARDIAYECDVGKALLQHIRHKRAHQGFGGLANRGKRRHENQPADRKPACQVNRRPGANGPAEKDDLLVRDFELIQNEPKGCQGHLLQGRLGRRRNAVKQAVAWILDSQDIHLELVPHVSHKWKTHTQVLCIPMAEENNPSCPGSREPNARNPLCKPLIVHPLGRDGFVPWDPTEMLLEGILPIGRLWRREEELIDKGRHVSTRPTCQRRPLCLLPAARAQQPSGQ